MKRFVTIVVVAGAALLIFLMLGPFYVVQEGQQAIVLQFGRIVNTKTTAGLALKAPLIDQVVRFPKKIISWDGEPTEVPTQERQFIFVDTTARWRIVNPELFYESVTDEAGAQTRLDAVIDSAVKEVISAHRLYEAVRNSDVIIDILERREEEEADDEEEILGAIQTRVPYAPIVKGRNQLSTEMLERAQVSAPLYGIQLIDVIIRQIRYSDDLTESVYSRMITERQQLAQYYRSDGEGKKAEWLGNRERERLLIISGAERTAKVTRGEADAEAAAIYADAYSSDPEFYAFFKAIEAYRALLPNFQKTLSTDAEFFDYLYSQQR